MSKYIRELIQLSKKAYNNGDVPVGALIVKNGDIISQGYNMREQNNDCIMHAEIAALSNASKFLNSWHLDECILYTTMEPCIMCYGACVQSHINKIYYITKNDKFGCTQFLKKITIPIYQLNTQYNEEYIKLLQDFFKSKR